MLISFNNHFFLHLYHICESHSVVSNSLQPKGLYSPWNSPGQNTGKGSLFLLQGIVPNQGSNTISHIAGSLFTRWATKKLVSQAVKSLSQVTQSCLTLCDPMDCSTPGLPVHHQLPEFTQNHVHWVGNAWGLGSLKGFSVWFSLLESKAILI